MTDYKDTLNLPYTKFSMRANLTELEIDILNRWYEDGLYKIIRNKKNKRKLFLLHDGPPYANGQIHLGHAVNKILKDIVIKFKGFSGYNAPYIPGWDCHGLPIELKVEQLIKKTGDCIRSQEFQEFCRQYAMNQVLVQKKDFIRLGILGDWDNAYLTMNFQTEANIIRSLNKVMSNGYIYKGIKPVYWCFQCCSALANLEVEYYNHSTYAVDIGFSIVKQCNLNYIFNTDLSLHKQKIECIIWTTTLWTLPANCAIAVHPDYCYQLIEMTHFNRYIVIASKLVETFMKRIQCYDWKILGKSIGKNLEFLKVYHPIMLYEVPIILSNHVTLESGTGIVHIAANYGPEDHILASKYNIMNTVDVIDHTGHYLPNVHEELIGKHIFESNGIIINLLNKSNNLLHINTKYKHNYPYCWRHKTPLIFRATSQWFLSMNHNNLRKKLLQIIQKVTWIPEKAYDSMKTMLISRPDWCISRQRYWGVPMPILINKVTGTMHPNTFELMEKIAQLVEKKGIQAWWNLKVEDILPNKEAICYTKIYDTLDVWFDSGSTYDSVMLRTIGDLEKNGADLYLEGSDQYRGWFMSSLIISVAINDCAPYKTVLSHGFTVDSEGSKMSKSIGNVINPQSIVTKFGSDILRLWIASSNYSKEISISNDILLHVTDVYRRIRNTIRFCLANLNDFNPDTDIIQPVDMVALDRWIVDHAVTVQCKIISYYKKYQFHNVVKSVMQFCSIEMSSFYLDVIKDRQYTFKKNSLPRRSCQTALYHIIEAMVRWIAPILSFTADQAWNYIPGQHEKYVFTEEWYDGLVKMDQYNLINEDIWKIFFQIRNKVNKSIEQARINGVIKSSLEADIILYIDSKLLNQIRVLSDELSFGLLISSITILDYDKFSGIKLNNGINLKVFLKKSVGIKCLRCWNYTMDIGQHVNYSDICSRCVQNIIGTGENRKFF